MVTVFCPAVMSMFKQATRKKQAGEKKTRLGQDDLRGRVQLSALSFSVKVTGQLGRKTVTVRVDWNMAWAVAGHASLVIVRSAATACSQPREAVLYKSCSTAKVRAAAVTPRATCCCPDLVFFWRTKQVS